MSAENSQPSDSDKVERRHERLLFLFLVVVVLFPILTVMTGAITAWPSGCSSC